MRLMIAGEERRIARKKTERNHVRDCAPVKRPKMNATIRAELRSHGLGYGLAVCVRCEVIVLPR